MHLTEINKEILSLAKLTGKDYAGFRVSLTIYQNDLDIYKALRIILMTSLDLMSLDFITKFMLSIINNNELQLYDLNNSEI